jgi:poly-gamma-glutamate synthesis protein (capsule biosynthesis protein)
MNRFLYIILIIVLVGLAGFIVLGSIQINNGFVARNKKTQTSSLIKANSGLKAIGQEKENSTITLFAVGDIMLDRGVRYMVKKQGGGDFKFPFLKIADYLQKADILFGNLESVISDKGVKVGSIYSFRAEPEAIGGLTYAGFDVVSVANNHIFDYGRKAMEDSFRRLKEAGISYAGGGFNEKEVREGITKTVKGVKITFLAYTNKGSKYWQATKNRSGIGWLDERIKGDIKKAKEKSDLVIVSLHWGEEYHRRPNKEQEYFGRLAIDSGADLVIGSHPHVVQPVEKYKNGWIAYSLGNFVFDQKFSKSTMEGVLLEALIKNRKIEEVKSKKIKISDNFQPYIAVFP